MALGLSTRQFCRLAHSSTAKTLLASVAVVSTGVAPQTPAMRRARSLAPPRWPDRMGTAKWPHSSTTTTAGSSVLLLTWGAMARTAMPAAPTNTSPPAWEKARRVQSARGWDGPHRAASPPRAAASRSARASPLSEKARYRSGLTAGCPPGIPW